MPGGGAQACVSMGYCASTADLRINCTFCINTFAQQMAQWLAQPGLLIAQPVQQANTMSGSYYSYNGQSAAPGGASATPRAGRAPRDGVPRDGARDACMRVPACESPATFGFPGRLGLPYPTLNPDPTLASEAGGARGPAWGRRRWRAHAGVPWQLVFQCNDTASNVADMLSMAGQIGAEMAPVFAAGASNATAICYGHPDICSGPNNSPGTPLPRCGAPASGARPPHWPPATCSAGGHAALSGLHGPRMSLSAPMLQAAHVQV